MHSLACKVQSSTLSHSIWTSTCLFTTPASNPPPQLHRILHSTCQSTAQKSSVRMKSGDYTTCFQTVAKTPASLVPLRRRTSASVFENKLHSRLTSIPGRHHPLNFPLSISFSSTFLFTYVRSSA